SKAVESACCQFCISRIAARARQCRRQDSGPDFCRSNRDRRRRRSAQTRPRPRPRQNPKTSGGPCGAADFQATASGRARLFSWLGAHDHFVESGCRENRLASQLTDGKEKLFSHFGIDCSKALARVFPQSRQKNYGRQTRQCLSLEQGKTSTQKDIP